MANFTPADFERLRQDYGVTWVILQKNLQRAILSLSEFKVLVCRLDQGVASK